MNKHLPRPAYILLAIITAAIGLASSAVTADFFVLGLQRMEADTVARQSLIAAGILMIVTELAAFGLAALLPASKLRALRGVLVTCGLMLLAFEATTIYVTQSTLSRNADTLAASNVTRITQLRTSIAMQRAAADSLQSNGAAQSASDNSWTRQVGAKALRESIELTAGIAPLVLELATLESGKRATMTDVLGEQGVIWYAVARAMLISIMGLVMFGAAGALMRAGRGDDAKLVPTVAQVIKKTAGFDAVSATPAGFKSSVPSRAWAVPLAAVAAITSPVVSAMPATSQAVPNVDATEKIAKIEIETKIESSISKKKIVKAKIEAPRLKISPKAELAESRYQRVREAVACGACKPAILDVKALAGVGGEAAMVMLARLENEGVTVRTGRFWSVA